MKRQKRRRHRSYDSCVCALYFCAHSDQVSWEKPKKERMAIRAEMEEVPEDESMLLVATGKLIGEGVDFPRLDTLIMAAPVAGESVLTQYAGRLNRDYEKKEDVIIFDYIDILIPQFERMYKKRLAAYKTIGYEICASPMPEQQKAHVVFDIDNYGKRMSVWGHLLRRGHRLQHASYVLHHQARQRAEPVLRPVHRH